MDKNIPLSSPLKRIKILDSLRGFALLGVILMHMIQHFGIRSLPSEIEFLSFPVLDEAVQWIGNNIIMGRFINIFAFLFGLSFFIQMDRATKKGVDFRLRFVWRMILLLVMGLLAHSFFNLEIISLYAFFGLLMLPLYRVKNWLLLSIVAFLLLGGPRTIQAINHNSELGTEQVDAVEPMNNGQAPRDLAEHFANPSFLNSLKHNYKERLPGKINYQFGYFGRGYVTFALFIIGLIVGRIRFFERLDEWRKRSFYLFIGFVSATLLVIWVQTMLPPPDFSILFRPNGQYMASSLLAVMTLQDLELVLFSGALALGFTLLYQNMKFGKYLEVLSPYGRTALTNYIMQGVIGALLFAPWALGSTFSNWGVTSLFLLGIVIYVVQIVCSKYWLKHFLYGPLEWLWRSGTYLELQPFRKK
ncbi:DUF418 domain-containing protein [Maribacter sp. TH_r10]|uniref:DUF418 domain-containing protein n=1 Tax=Maribacter sp. TH_r10 TaxID=3082086 RepID=UPI002953712A|nr:DUF418 domain-containing protein [Maribacter sp. TH_r10]MDV7137255.1 DUF418 domain-containing protein [Maribacter sp. TH_r10]